MGAWASTFGFWHMAAFYLGPLAITNCWLVMYTWLQHTDVDVPHFDGDNWNYIKGAFMTIDRPYGAIFDSSTTALARLTSSTTSTAPSRTTAPLRPPRPSRRLSRSTTCTTPPPSPRWYGVSRPSAWLWRSVATSGSSFRARAFPSSLRVPRCIYLNAAFPQVSCEAAL